MNTPTVSHLAYTEADIDKACNNILAHLWDGTGWYTNNTESISDNSRAKYLCLLVEKFVEGKLRLDMLAWIREELDGRFSFDTYLGAVRNYRLRKVKVRKMRGELKRRLLL